MIVGAPAVVVINPVRTSEFQVFLQVNVCEEVAHEAIAPGFIVGVFQFCQRVAHIAQSGKAVCAVWVFCIVDGGGVVGVCEQAKGFVVGVPTGEGDVVAEFQAIRDSVFVVRSDRYTFVVVVV